MHMGKKSTWEYKVSFCNKVLLENAKVNKIKSRLNRTIVFLMTGSCTIAGQKQSLLKGTGKWEITNENNLRDS